MKPNLIVIGFRVERPQGLTVRVYRQLKSHFEELGLASRYRVNALVELSEDRRAFARWFGGDGSGAKLAEELALKADDRELEYGANDWLCVLYRKLAHTPAFTSGGFRVLDAIQ